MIKEWNLLRVVACLSIVLLHSTTQTAAVVGLPEIENYDLYRILLVYATPTFIVLSMVILSNRYPDRLPDNFWMSRFQFILFPYLAFGIIDGLVGKYFNPNLSLSHRIIDNIFTGSFVGWFIIVIFQFYALHYLVTRFKLSMTWMFPVSLAVMIWYLTLINGEYTLHPDYDHVLKLPFLAWFGYFTAAFIIGKHYKVIAEKLYKHRWVTLLYVGLSVYILYLSYMQGNTAIHSRRIDIIPLVLSISTAVLAWGQAIPKFKIITLLNNYAFGIYLVHWPVQRFLAPYTAAYFQQTSTRVLALFFVTLIITVMIIKLISMLPLGQFIVGKVKKNSAVDRRMRSIEQSA
ncbi:acyltransferase family protein [Bacillus dakarensis]|uniref:acyltransferase family protein n=1 Tax=Robertmurraya dakarensis TaxID=1926278 RepID=UPI0009824CD4|nr:acyltransferase family protein [Bacillus dakarensis]